MILSTSNITRIAIGLRDARKALGQDFLAFPERGIGALFDLCVEDQVPIREIARTMRSDWILKARESLNRGEAIEEKTLPPDDQWIVRVFNYAYGLKGLSSEPPAVATSAAAPSQPRRTGVFVGIGAGALVAAGFVFLMVSKGPQPSTPLKTRLASALPPPVASTPEMTPIKVVTPPKPAVEHHEPTKVPIEHHEPPKAEPINRERVHSAARRTRREEVAERPHVRAHVAVARHETKVSVEREAPPEE